MAHSLVQIQQTKEKPSVHALQDKDLAACNADAQHVETIMDRKMHPLESRKV